MPAPEKVGLPEERQDVLCALVGNRQRLDTQLLLHLKGLKAGRSFFEVSIDQSADACVVIPTVASERITPHTEGFCAVVWHLLVSHPRLKRAETKWESTV